MIRRGPPCLRPIDRCEFRASSKVKYLLFLILAPFGAYADTVEHDPLWQGIWTYQPGWCAYASKIGSHTPAPIRFSAARFDGYENSCTIKTSTQTGDLRAWVLDMTCQSESSTFDEQTLVMLADDNTLWQFTGAGAPVKFTRCKE